MNVHVINRADTWSTARPFIAADDLVVWTDAGGIRGLAEELKSVGLRIVCLDSGDAENDEIKHFPVISDQAWVQYVFDSTTVCSWG